MIGALLLLVAAALAGQAWWRSAAAAEPAPLLAAPKPKAVPKPGPPPVPQPPPVEEVLRSGVLIVVSKGSQQAFVYKDGALWGASPVSTGKRGKATPSGVFPILQKRVFHRSNLYSNAPMPYMQRLTWSGIALHAGHLPGYPASHGCIRLPRDFARKLFALTDAARTTVVVASEPLKSEYVAREFALSLPAVKQPAPKLPYPPYPAVVPTALASAPGSAAPLASAATAPLRTPRAGPVQTIQLVAAASAAEAEAHWARLLGERPELGQFQKVVVPAVVGSRRVYRLRASAGDAHAYCRALKSSGIDCFNVS